MQLICSLLIIVQLYMSRFFFFMWPRFSKPMQKTEVQAYDLFGCKSFKQAGYMYINVNMLIMT